jgi:hypothetical protein
MNVSAYKYMLVLAYLCICVWASSADCKQQMELSKREKWLVPVSVVQSK